MKNIVNILIFDFNLVPHFKQENVVSSRRCHLTGISVIALQAGQTIDLPRFTFFTIFVSRILQNHQLP